jgi:type I restriction-modification system DNA methylase subunit
MIRTKRNIQFIQSVLSVFVQWEHDGKDYIQYLRSARGGDEFDMRDWFVEPIFEKLGYEKGDFNHEHPLFSGKPDFFIKPTMFPPLIAVETKPSFATQKDFLEARTSQLFPAMKELHTPTGVLTNGVRFELYHQVGRSYQRVVELDFSGLVIACKKKGVDGLNDEHFEKLIKLLWLKKSNQAIKDEDFYPPPQVDISEPTQFEMLLDDLAAVVEMVKIDVEERFDILLHEHDDYEERARHLKGYELKQLQREKRDAIKARRFYEKWAEINNIDLKKNGGAKEKFITETMYILVNRILLIRIAEDKEIINRRISNGAIKDYKEYVKEIRVNYSKLLDEGYRTIEALYEHLFKRDIFDWYNPDSELLMKVLFTFNRYNFAKVNRDILGNLYQKYIDKEERKRLGQFYTPHEVIDYILDSVGYTAQNEIENKMLLDPACGSGGFLVPAVNRLVGRLRSKNFDAVTILSKVKDNVYGFDINPFAAHLAETNLLFQVVDLIKEAQEEDKHFRLERFNICVTDSLRLPENGKKQEELFDQWLGETTAVEDLETVKDVKLKRGKFKNGVDFVVGNPPYLASYSRESIKMAKSDKEYYARIFKTVTGRINTFALFLEQGLNFLRDGVSLGYIVPKTFLTMSSYRLLRKYLLQFRIEEFCMWGDAVFEDVIVPSVVVVIRKTTPDSTHVIAVKEIVDAGVVELKNELRQSAALEDQEFRFFLASTPAVDAIVDKLREGSESLGGIAYVEDGINPGPFRKNLVLDHKLNEKCMRLIKGEDFSRYSPINWAGRFFLWDKSYIHQLQPTHPNSIAVLGSEERFLSSEKIVTRQTAHAITATLDTDMYFCLNSVHTTRIKDICRERFQLKYVLGILNSRLIGFLFEVRFKEKGKTFPQVKIAKLKQVPIKAVSFRVQEPISSLVDRMISISRELGQIEKPIDEAEQVIPTISIADSTFLSYVNLQQQLGKPKIERNQKRVYLSRNNFIDLSDEKAAECVERNLKAIVDRLRGMSKAELLRTVRLPRTLKGIEAVLEQLGQLVERKKKLEKEKVHLDEEINQEVYRLYGLTEEEIEIVERS